MKALARQAKSEALALASEDRLRRALASINRKSKDVGTFAMRIRQALIDGRTAAGASAVAAIDAELRTAGLTPPLARSVDTAALDKQRASSAVDSLTARWTAEDNGGALPGGALVDVLETTAATEAFDATNRARMARLGQVTDDSVRARWSGFLDPKICDRCMALDGDTVRPSVGFTGGAQPPLHPRCRCLVHAAREVMNDQGVITSNSAKVRRIERAA